MQPVAFVPPLAHKPMTADAPDETLLRTTEFFQSKGLVSLKDEDQRELWYDDWIAFQAEHHLYASVLSPRRYSTLGNRWHLLRYARFAEKLTYYSPAHAYSLHVSLLGLTPILLSSNEALKQEAVSQLERGGLFAFGISEQAHGADLLSNEFTVRPSRPGWLVANGSKYYIGNCNVAGMITTLARKVESNTANSFKRAPLVLFVLRPVGSPGVGNVRKIHTVGIRSAFVGAFDVSHYELPETDVLCEGHDAWDTTFATVNVGKMMLGFGSIGICEHATEEATDYLRRRVLFGKPVSQMPHLRWLTAQAYARLAAMKLYAYRALDYFASAHSGDRRDLLFNAVQKAKVGSEGVAVVETLAECVGARGFEAATYFEMALRDIRLIPTLEGSTHINFGAAAAYLRDYFAEATADLPEVPALTLARAADDGEKPITTFGSGRPGEVGFADYLRAYRPLSGVANVALFAELVTAFRQIFFHELPAWSAKHDLDVSVAVGRCAATVVYGQLIAERAVLDGTPPELVSVIFHQLVLELAAEVRGMALIPKCPLAKSTTLKAFDQLPLTTAADFSFVSERMERGV